ncbi:MAG: hypothetical protein KDK65_05790 [Chlamydiia bacterium]|nr:hypothetical protein [Chlamydiia bacterium]
MMVKIIWELSFKENKWKLKDNISVEEEKLSQLLLFSQLLSTSLVNDLFQELLALSKETETEEETAALLEEWLALLAELRKKMGN